MDWFVLFVWTPCLLIFPCHSVPPASNQLTGSIPSKLGELRYVDWFIFFIWMSRLLTFPCHSVPSASNQLTGSIPSKLGELTLLTELYIRTWIGFSCWHVLVGMNAASAHICLPLCFFQKQINSWVPLTELYIHTWIGLSCWHECHAGSYFLALLCDQIKMIWQATLIRCFVIDHFWCCCWFFFLIAVLKLSAAAALHVINADKGTFSIINEDYILDNRHTI
jgi:hypothetical protein